MKKRRSLVRLRAKMNMKKDKEEETMIRNPRVKTKVRLYVHPFFSSTILF